MVEIRAEAEELGEQPISVRGYVDRDEELMVIFCKQQHRYSQYY